MKERLVAAGVELCVVKEKQTHGGVAHYKGYAPLPILREIFGRPQTTHNGFHSWYYRGKTYYYEIATSSIVFRK